MGSTMLEQAVIDANALKEAALKNAEQQVVEKYAPKIKEAVLALLEQSGEGEEPLGDEEVIDDEDFSDEELLGGDEEVLGDEEDEEEEEDMLGKVPLSAAKLDEEEIIEIDLPELRRQMQEMLRQEASDEILEHEDLNEVIEEEDDEIELDEETLKELAEALVVDLDPMHFKKSGWLGTPDSDGQEALEVAVAIAKVEEENETKKSKKDKKELELHKKLYEDLKNNKKELEEKNKKYKDIILEMKNYIEKVNLVNARLLYTNKALGNYSLNERQKKQIVEKISNSQTIQEAKTVFETLQSAVQSSFKKDKQSLSEVIGKSPSSLILHSNNNEEKKVNPVKSRMLKLAGLEKK